MNLQTHLDRWRVNQRMCRDGPDRYAYLRAWYLSRLRIRLPWLVPESIRLRVCVNGRTLLLPVRTNTDDALVLRGVFADREYETSAIPDGIRSVLDLGGNCGFGLAYLAARYPQAQFATVEPDPHNLQQLQKTILWNQLPATIFPAAIAPTRELLNFEMNADHPSCNRAVSGGTGWRVPAITIGEALDAMNWPGVDLIKMDVEGMEHPLVTKAGAEFQRARHLLFELHGGIPGQEVLETLRALHFEVNQINHQGEQVYLATNTRPLP